MLINKLSNCLTDCTNIDNLFLAFVWRCLRCSGVVVEYRTQTQSTASNLEQVANLLCAQANSAFYFQRDGKWVIAVAMGWRPSVADWGSDVSASCTVGLIVWWRTSTQPSLFPGLGTSSEYAGLCTWRQTELVTYLQFLTCDIDIANLSVRLSVTLQYQMKTA